MSYSIKLSDNNHYLIITIDAEITTDLAKKFSIDARDKGIEHDIDRFLFDARNSPNIESSMKNYTYAYDDMPAMELNRFARSAILTSPQDQSHSFIETLSKNAGYNVRLFIDEKAAVKWLMEND